MKVAMAAKEPINAFYCYCTIPGEYTKPYTDTIILHHNYLFKKGA